MTTMGDRIKQKRIQMDLTMEELGNMVGVQKSAVSKWEKNIVQNIKRSIIQDLATALDCDPVWLMYGDDVSSESTSIVLSAVEKEIIEKFRTSEHQEAILTLLGIDSKKLNSESYPEAK